MHPQIYIEAFVAFYVLNTPRHCLTVWIQQGNSLSSDHRYMLYCFFDDTIKFPSQYSIWVYDFFYRIDDSSFMSFYGRSIYLKYGVEQTLSMSFILAISSSSFNSGGSSSWICKTQIHTCKIQMQTFTLKNTRKVPSQQRNNCIWLIYQGCLSL
jgi:hypothetical protein